MRRHFGAAILAAVALAACGEKPVATEPTTNANVKVDLLFQHDGRKVYRFVDGPRVVYFTTPGGDAHSEHIESCGKACTRRVVVQTMAAQD